MTTVSASAWTPDFSVSSLEDKVPVLAKGIYTAEVSKAVITNKEGKDLVGIQKLQRWDSTAKARVEVLDDYNNPIYVISGMIGMYVKLTSKKALSVLKVDEKSFYHSIFLTFDKDFHLDKVRNQKFKDLMKVFGITDAEIEGLVDFNNIYSEHADIPEGLENVENIVLMVNVVNYWREVLTIICNIISNRSCRIIIDKKSEGGRTQNVIAADQDSSGLLAYKEGAENDL